VHHLAFVQDYDLVLDKDSCFGVPVVQLSQEYRLVYVDSVDKMIDLKPKRLSKHCFYVIDDVKQY
jgi:hypothetical protein